MAQAQCLGSLSQPLDWSRKIKAENDAQHNTQKSDYRRQDPKKNLGSSSIFQDFLLGNGQTDLSHMKFLVHNGRCKEKGLLSAVTDHLCRFTVSTLDKANALWGLVRLIGRFHVAVGLYIIFIVNDEGIENLLILGNVIHQLKEGKILIPQ